uniref:Uncharacterized protein n=1 Tax=Anguilla anguilla TaxID=7936 RepID=A0A0E9SBA5_ANGAN
MIKGAVFNTCLFIVVNSVKQYYLWTLRTTKRVDHLKKRMDQASTCWKYHR